MELEIKWKGYDDTTFEPMGKIKQDIKYEVQAYMMQTKNCSSA